MSDENYKNKLLTEIEKTGFPLELRISRFLQDKKYYVANNLYYVDQDEEKGREIDIRALRNFDFMTGEKDYFVRHCFLFECKKSKKNPWIIFTSPKTFYDEILFMADARGINKDDSWNNAEIGRKASTVHLYASFERRGRSFFEPFKKNDREMIFKSLTQVVKATISARDNNFAAGNRSICFYYPGIIFEGELFEAFLENGKITLKEAETILVSFYYESPKYKNERFSVPIINEQSLPKFSSSMDEALHFFGELFKAHNNWFNI